MTPGTKIGATLHAGHRPARHGRLQVEPGRAAGSGPGAPGYRTMTRLAELGVVQPVASTRGPTKYRLVLPDEKTGSRICCRTCGLTLDLPGDVVQYLAASVARNVSFVFDPDDVTLAGICLECAHAP